MQHRPTSAVSMTRTPGEHPMNEIKGKRARELRAAGHHLNPAVTIGKGGIGKSQLAALDEALSTSGLVKVRLLEAEGAERRELAELLADETGAAIAQVLGKTVLLWREPQEAE
ncbi:MAG: YhbY family RNA-binding protein [Deltaproteobacteria bacterium]|nr:YhbY family RNA-binding protein [Deltaproteobacteria bacterium]